MQLPDSIQLRRDTGLPVLPVALFLRVGLDGVGWDAYEEHFWEHRVVRFEYAYVGLPALESRSGAGLREFPGCRAGASVPREPRVTKKLQPVSVRLTRQQLRRTSADSNRFIPAHLTVVVQEELKQYQVVVPQLPPQAEVASQRAVKVLDQTAGPHNLIG